MFSALINNVATAAQAVLQTPALPPQAQPVRDHATAYSSAIMPMLRRLSAQVSVFAQQASGTNQELRPYLDAWKAGDNAAHDAILRALQNLHQSALALLSTDQADFTALSQFRDQVLGDQRQVAQLLAEMNARLAGLRSVADSRRHELDDQEKRLTVLRFIPFAWAIAEIASLISSSKSLEQQISELTNEITQLAGQAAQVNHAEVTVQGFSSQLQLLENSMQTMLNAIILTQGQTQQILQSVQGGQQGGPVLLEAYLATLKSQAEGLIAYLNT